MGLIGLAENKEDYEEEQVEVMELDQEDEEESIMDMGFEIEEVIEDEDEDEKEEEDGEYDVYENLVLHPQVTRWFDPVGKTNYGIKVMDVRLSTECKRYSFDLCPICLEPWTYDKIHQLCCVPCGHMFGMSCLKEWMEGRSRDKCPQCYKVFLLESVRLLYANRLCIPSAADRKASFRRFPFNKKGFTTFKQYERELRTNALINMSETLKKGADILGRHDDAMKRVNNARKRRTRLLNLMANAEKQVNVLKRHNDAAKRKTGSLNRMTDEEEWAEVSQRQTYVEKRAETLRRRADVLGQRADEYLRKADVFGQQANALLQQAKSLRQLIVSYKASKTFYIQRYKEFLGLRDNKTTE